MLVAPEPPASSEASLRGFVIGITADRRADEQAALFERRGATVLYGPTIRTLPVGEEHALRRVTATTIAEPPEVLIATTGIGLRSWLGAADSWGAGPELLAALENTRVWCRGAKALAAAHIAGLSVDRGDSRPTLAGVIDSLIPTIAPGTRVAVQVDGSGGSEELARLRAAGAVVTTVSAYEWTQATDAGPATRLIRAVIAGRVDAVTFTVGAAFDNLVALAAAEGRAAELLVVLRSGAVVVGCVGPVCAAALERHGLDPVRLTVPAVHRLGPLVRAVAEAVAARRCIVEIAGAQVTLTGATFEVDGRCYALTEVEARLLAALVAGSTGVVAKTDLAAAVWPGENADPHRVEVTVARLRRRLGPDGVLIHSVRRRGYTLRPADILAHATMGRAGGTEAGEVRTEFA